MHTTINESLGKEKLTIACGAATVGRPSGVNGKKMAPRRARVSKKELDKLNTKGYVKAGGPGSGRHPMGTYDQRMKKAQQIIEQEKNSSKSKTHDFHNYQDKTKNGTSLKVGWERKSSQWEPREKVSPKAHKQLSQLADVVKPSTSDMTDNTRYVFKHE